MKETSIGAEQIMTSTGVLNEVITAVNEKAREVRESHGAAAEDMAAIVRTMDGLKSQMASILEGTKGIRGSMERLRARSDELIGLSETLDKELRGL
jgi:methyl-accepting chemotaxis protein